MRDDSQIDNLSYRRFLHAIQFRYSSMPNYSCLKDVTIIVMQHAHPYIKTVERDIRRF